MSNSMCASNSNERNKNMTRFHVNGVEITKINGNHRVFIWHKSMQSVDLSVLSFHLLSILCSVSLFLVSFFFFIFLLILHTCAVVISSNDSIA